MSNPFKEVAQEYFDKGWSPVPLPYKKKANPPVGYTGRKTTKKVDQDAIDKWVSENRPRNIAVRVDDNMLGIDVDDYDDKGGAKSLQEAEAKRGRLPDTCITTSRTDKVSGIRLFRVPPGLAWAGKDGPGIDIVQSGHRYAVVWPSLHPEGRTYRWLENEIPEAGKVPDLPQTWIDDLSQGPLGEVLVASDISTKEASEWLDTLPGGRICWTVHNAMDKAADRLDSNRHDSMKDCQWELVRLGTEGHRGVRRALAVLRELFFEQILGDAEREKVAGHEYYSALNSAIKKNYEVEHQVLCDCGEVPDLVAEHKPKKKTENLDIPLEDLILTPASQVEPRAIIWLWGPSKHKRDQDGFVPLGELVLLAGAPNLGKSTLAVDMASNLSRGTMRGKFHGTPKSIFIGTTEDSWSRTIVPRLMAARADLDRVFRIESQETGGLRLPKDVIALERKIKEHDAAMLILDPLTSTIDARLDAHKEQDLRRALEPLTKIAQRTDSTILGLIHNNKSSTTDPNKSIMGGRAFVAVARTILYVAKHPDEPNVRILGVPKNNLAKTDPDSLKFTIAELQVGWDSEADEPITAPKLEWTGLSELSISDVMEQSKRTTRTHSNPAQEWLEKYLQEQARCVPKKEVLAAANAVGISESQLRRAREALGVDTSRTRTTPSTSCWQDTAQSLLEGMNEDTDLSSETD